MELHEKARLFAEMLIREEKVIYPDSWEAPDSDSENEYIDENDLDSFSEWHLGFREEENPDTKGAWAYIFTSDFENLDASSLDPIIAFSARFDHSDIEQAARDIRGMLEADNEARVRFGETLEIRTQAALNYLKLRITYRDNIYKSFCGE